MKKLFFPLIIILITLYSSKAFSQYQTGNTIKDYCTSSESKAKAKKALDKEYKYDASKTTKFKYKESPQRKEIEIPLYWGEEYRFVFNREGLPQDVVINIYNKSYEKKKKELLFSSRTYPDDEKQIIWEPEKSRKMYLNYEIPATNDTIKKGCIVMVLGYKIKGFK